MNKKQMNETIERLSLRVLELEDRIEGDGADAVFYSEDVQAQIRRWTTRLETAERNIARHETVVRKVAAIVDLVRGVVKA